MTTKQFHWTLEADEKAKALFATLTEQQIRRRQELCERQLLLVRPGQDRALHDLQAMQNALLREMLRRN